MHARSFCYLVLAVAVLSIPHVQGQTLTVTDPQRPPWEEFTILGNQVAEVWVNVTSSYTLANVTLRYLAWPNDSSPPQTPSALARYTPIEMHAWSGNQTFATYDVTMPRVENNSFVWGFARAYDRKGNHAESDLRRIYYYTIPNPNSSYLRLILNVRHIDPRNLQMNLTADAWLNNAATYQPEALDIQGQPDTLLVYTSYGAYEYGNNEKNLRLYYYSGLPQLFPFDRYNYTFELLVPTYLNRTGVVINSQYGDVSLKPDSPAYAGLIGENAQTQEEALDNSIWDVQSVSQYDLSQNFTASHPYLRVTITLVRHQETVNYLLLIPTFSLYALLGLSILLRGKDQIQNRLLLYITVFGFSYTLQPTIKTIAPIVFGFSMIDRVTIALIPCTVILSVFSIISTTWNRADPQNDSVSGWDIAGVIGAALALYAITRLTVTGLLGYYQKTFTLFDTGLYGWALLGALFLGLLIGPSMGYLRQRYLLIAPRFRAFPSELHKRLTVHRRKGR